MLDVLRRK